MPALIYDKTQNAWKEAEKPKIWHPDQNAFGKAEGKIYVPSQNAWKDTWVNRLPDVRLNDMENSAQEDYVNYAQAYGVNAGVGIMGSVLYPLYEKGYRYISFDVTATGAFYFNTAYPSYDSYDVLSMSAVYYAGTGYWGTDATSMSVSKYFARYSSSSAIRGECSSGRIKRLIKAGNGTFNASTYTSLGGVWVYASESVWFNYNHFSYIIAYCKASNIIVSVD